MADFSKFRWVTVGGAAGRAVFAGTHSAPKYRTLPDRSVWTALAAEGNEWRAANDKP